jgi:hypothetical protein
MEEAPEKGKESSHSAQAKGMNEWMTSASDRAWTSNKNRVLFQIRYNCSYALLLFRLRYIASCVTLTSQTANRSDSYFETKGRYFGNVTFCLHFIMNKYEFTVNKLGSHPRSATSAYPRVHSSFNHCWQFCQYCFLSWNSIKIFFLIGAIPMCFHLNILSVSSVKTQLIYCQL